MKKIIVLFIFNLLLALPRFSIETGSSCLSCHVNPNGGGGNSIDYPFLSSSKSDGFGALESKMIYNVVE